MELEEQDRPFRQIGLRPAVDGGDLDLVGKLDPRHRHARLDDRDAGLDRVVDAREGADRGRHCLRDAGEAERHLDDHAERPFRADEEPGQVVARRGLARPGSGADRPPVGQHDGEPQHVVAHRAVAHRVGARGARRGHAADRRVRARVDREEQAGVAEMGVELLAGHPRLDPDVEVGGVDLEHAVHPRHVDRDPAFERGDMALERGADAERDHRRPVLAAEPDDGDHLLDRLGEHDDVGREGAVVRFVAPVPLAHHRRGRDALSEAFAEPVREAVDGECRGHGGSPVRPGSIPRCGRRRTCSPACG